MLEHKAIGLADATITDEGIITGYASLFGQRDDGGDTVVRGAFTKTLAIRAGRPMPMLREHEPRDVIGVWTDYTEDDRGLRVKGQLALDVQDGREAHGLIKMGALDGLSIGYKTLRFERDGEGRRLTEVRLFETSIVTFPMLGTARIDSVKAAEMTANEIEERLTRGAGLSRTVARALMRSGLPAIQAKRDAGDGAVNRMAHAVLSDLKAINRS
ncbi:HK97 family phage prohead protease [Brevundimonas sp. S30B]|uniref:HK97 family phage prohead protease n=1 Tax=unclassified Brevundimonas TaxID=2622653 RepID=UPI001071B43F|nr:MULTISPECIES: HK97 family phage prohead protease [unclassified Brevundimonas]QBX37228.1 HK97 family phage prohead protease [Brevundimonas sp. MF30-B]TFW03978.1 HK97 family phage prohead protease [Brevundimonas sp. S30B]